MKFKPHDVVSLKEAIPETNLRVGQQGTVHMAQEGDPPIYLIEFSSIEDEFLELVSLLEDKIELVWKDPTGQS